MNRIFRTDKRDNDGWTEGPDWETYNAARDLSGIYHRRYTGEEGDNNYRLSNGDNFFVGCPASDVQDWKPRWTPMPLDLDGALGGEISFYFGVQARENGIDAKQDTPAPFMYGVSGALFLLTAEYHRVYGLKLRDSGYAVRFGRKAIGLTIEDAVLDNADLIDPQGYPMVKCIFRKILMLGEELKRWVIGEGSSEVSIQDIERAGGGDIGIKIANGHSDIEVVGVSITNTDHGYEDTLVPVNGLEVGTGGDVVARYVEIYGFSGIAHTFDARVDAIGLESTRCGAGVRFGVSGSTGTDCNVSWLRQLDDLSYAYLAVGDLTLINCSCNLDETGGLGAIVGTTGTVRVIGGNYKARLPLPFLAALGDVTFILQDVWVNNVLYNETIEMQYGDSWRGGLSPITRDPTLLWNHMPVMFPYNHIPQMADAVSVEGSERPFETSITLPSGAKLAPLKAGSVKYYPDEAFLHLDPGETATERFRYSTPDNIYVHELTITGNPTVGPKLAQTDGLSGSGWNRTGSSYTAGNNSSSLTAAASLEAGEIYQISVHVSDITSGGLVPCIIGSSTVLGDEPQTVKGRRTWILRAPSSATAIGIKGQSFSGAVKDIYLRKVNITESAATPSIRSITKEGSDAHIVWRIPTKARLKDTVTANKTKSGELNSSAKFGYRDTSGAGDFLFEETHSTAKRSSISIRGGNTCEVHGHTAIGGYPSDGENATWQTGFQNGLNNGPYFSKVQIAHMKSDLKLESNGGWYGGPTHNSDCVVINGSYREESMSARTYMFDLDLKDSSDGVIDCKQYAEGNYIRLEGAYKPLRCHQSGLPILANSDLVQGINSRYAVGPTYSKSYCAFWNCAFDGIPFESKAKAESIKKTEGKYKGRGQIGEYTAAIHIIHSYPTFHDYASTNATDMEFQIRPTGGSWSSLAVPNTDVHNFRGSLERRVPLSAGTYEIRCRCRNGKSTGSWSNTKTVTI